VIPPTAMQWADALSTEPSLSDAVDACAAGLGDVPEGGFDLLVAFVSPAYDDLDDLAALLADRVPHRHLVGCTAGGVIAGGHEIEDGPALGVVAASLPGVTVTPFLLTQSGMEALGPGPGAWAEFVGGVPPGDAAAFVVLADPFTLRADALIEGMAYAYPAVPVVGGLASGGRTPGINRLYLDGEVHADGAVGACLSGDLQVETVVAQGVKGIGESHVITRADSQVLYELDGEPVFKVLERIFAVLPEEDAARASRGLFLGVAQRAEIDRPTHGDYLIRNVMGALEGQEALVVGELLREGQVVRFHVRDGATSAEDLALLLSAYAARHPEGPPAGALLFSCLGRGIHLYGEADHDTRAFKGIVGPAALGGFFCNGEIGPVGDGIYLHGYTSAFALFRPAGAATPES
jgi:small ligand-binding sensory domain FIST